jgi:hypothetical protein
MKRLRTLKSWLRRVLLREELSTTTGGDLWRSDWLSPSSPKLTPTSLAGGQTQPRRAATDEEEESSSFGFKAGFAVRRGGPQRGLRVRLEA